MSDCGNPLSFLVAKSLPWQYDERHEIYDQSIIFPQSAWRFHFDQLAVTFGLIPEISFACSGDQPQLRQVEKSPPHPWLISKNEGRRTPRSHIKYYNYAHQLTLKRYGLPWRLHDPLCCYSYSIGNRYHLQSNIIRNANWKSSHNPDEEF